MNCKIEYIPRSDDALGALVGELWPFIARSYEKVLSKVHGPYAFDLRTWIEMWDSQGAFFVTCRDSTGKLVGMMMCVKYRPIFYNRIRVDIDKTEVDNPTVEQVMLDYLKSVATVLGVEEIFQKLYADNGEERLVMIYG